jgi:hypothetical protein
MTTRLDVPTAEALMAKASEQAGGLADFGRPTFLDGLNVFLRSIAEDGGFTQEAATAYIAGFVGRLVIRLQVEEWYRTHPEIEAGTVVKPLMITGLPRTGTSAFASIMSLEPSYRCPRMWEQGSPVPPPILGEEETDPRRVAAQARLKEMAERGDEQMTMHLHELDSTSEDVPILGYEFKAQSFTTPTPGYHQWWRESDMRPAYGYLLRICKLLQSRRPPNRWLFKAPHYVFHLEHVLDAFPDAKFVVTHRDPVKTIPSWASLLSSLQPKGSLDLIGRETLAARAAEHQAIGMRRMIEARKRIGEDRFLDVHHHEFVDDPIAVLKRVYDFTDMPFTSETQARMADWSEKNRMGTRGKHVYSAQQFGLTEQGLREQFAFYTDAYGVRLERI